MKYMLLTIMSGLLSFSIVAYGKNKSYCSKNERLQANCFLKFKNYEVNLTKDSIRVFDGVRRAVHVFPLQPNAQWNKVVWRKLAGRNFIEIKVWDPVRTEASLQNLHWLVVELNREKLIKHIDGIVQTRKASVGNKKQLHDPIKPHVLKYKAASNQVILIFEGKSQSL